jgi:DNA-binding response OmpR family regulator
MAIRERRMDARFCWLSDAAEIPARWDLRLLGWHLDPVDLTTSAPVIYDGRDGARACGWTSLARPSLTLAVGVGCGEERAAMLAAGLGDALPAQVALGELSVRMTRLVLGAGALPRRRSIGPLILDLLHRDADVGGRWLALHPREFALLWRLADARGRRVPREQLLRDVWRLAHVPETNSLEVHVSRLRAKLAAAKVAWLVETDPRGGYRLASGRGEPRWTAKAPLPTVAAS